MAIKFRLKGLAETFIDRIICPCCHQASEEDDLFAAELTKVTLEGIVVVTRCLTCGELFLPEQRIGVIDPQALKMAVIEDAKEHDEPLLFGYRAVAELIAKNNQRSF
ncbi:MAG TPA: hypothetical protein PKD37_07840 [Oligoflexia bacterium]|nr:hypothetical protein [Oligoflexia bacterium]HMP27874.1 hypothetical protein [Oligoflexia bacterium]